jgi:4-hydroxy-tetrahydrodipicolinate synthase
MFEGVFTALITPFNKEGKVDEKALRKLVDFQVEQGIDGLVPVGTTGESPTLDPAEAEQVIRIVVEQASGRVPVIAGTGSNCTDKGFHRHFTAIADAVDLPMVVYNIPGRTGKNIENPVMLKLARHRNIVAVKEASGSIAQMMDLISKKPQDFTVLSGDDNLTFPLMALGGKGVVSVASNLVPQRMKALTQAALQGRWDEARRLHYELLPLFKAIFIETNPIPIKAAMALKGFVEEVYRLPMCPLAPENKNILIETLKELKVL